MFTGLVQGTGVVIARSPSGGGMVLTLEAGFALDDPREGESIAVNGACLTARNITGRRFLVDVSPETLTRTTLGRLASGGRVNLERALRLGDRLGGHLVSGHVDTVGQVEDRRPAGDFTLFSFCLPAELSRYLIEKGSVAVDGVSLTVNSCESDRFSVAIIPHTLTATTLGGLRQRDPVNLELDLIGKYVEKMLGHRVAAGTTSSGINADFLAQHGFMP
ncbi:MAG: riboflavin synthase [Desulfobulbaceae bacterium A2]|nr:MAG: riboflavin synthase [Desulfobulbaceae bacterium A2]